MEGSSLLDLTNKINPELGAKAAEMSQKTVSNCEAIPVPFDLALTQEKVGGKGPIMKAVLSLQDQGDVFTEVATALGVKIGTELPE